MISSANKAMASEKINPPTTARNVIAICMIAVLLLLIGHRREAVDAPTRRGKAETILRTHKTKVLHATSEDDGVGVRPRCVDLETVAGTQCYE